MMRRAAMATQTKQRGVALITVLLVFALVAVLAAEMLRRSQLNLRGVGNLIDSRQAYYYALAGENYARQILAKHHIAGRQQHKLSDDWARTAEQQPFEIEHGTMTVEIRDLQGRFNLNNVVDNQGLVSGDGLAQLQRLLAAVGADGRYAAEWADWVDRDQQRAANGAEDPDYEHYRTAGRREVDASALRLLRSMTPEDYAKLAPHVALLPETTKVNVNTADAAVLRALSPSITEAKTAQIIARQQREGYNDALAFQQSAGLIAAGQAPDVAVNSNYFEVTVTVDYDNRWQRLRTVLRRDNNSGQVSFAVISRARSPLIDDIEL